MHPVLARPLGRLLRKSCRMATPPPTTHPAPETLESALAAAGLTARLLVERRDGRPLDANDQAALRVIVQGHDLEHGRHISDDEAARIASHAFAAAPLPSTGTGGE
jgi:hypothetical protein